MKPSFLFRHGHVGGRTATPVAAAIAALLAAQSSHAADKYWDGGVSERGWDDVANWSTASGATTPNPSAVPGSSDIAHFNISTVNTAQVVTLKKNQSAAGLVFANTSTTTLQGGTESGKNYTLTLGASGILVNSGAGNVTIGSTTLGNVSITLNAAQSWTNSATSTLTIVNNVTNGSNLLTVAGTGNTTINGVIGSGSGGLAKNGTGMLTLSGTNTYTGVTTLTSGILSVATIGNGGVAGNLGKANNAASNLVFNGGTGTNGNIGYKQTDNIGYT